MGRKATGQPTVRRQRDQWVVRVDVIDTATGTHRPRQLGTNPRSVPTVDARLFEVGIVVTDDQDQVIHTMPARGKYLSMIVRTGGDPR